MLEAKWLEETRRYYRRGMIVGFIMGIGITAPIIAMLWP